ncbi:type III secretion system chaperone YscY [Yersinia enterocolitica]|uniref:Chaperone protein YscY n=1 Tax=Yersinia enterocolitica serotype O:8 / biotype 1B (strain NCTC 13174 / 8081) TaxID=393305 RepID=YSCY_YERE8|nr:type III secretion system chaperone YscY [Yersinia enterocolitica]A1JU77.1 RecName: Full=Chaperone protein YscY; AltName: Full=Yop proteins translocation protein Y [Yersinia enterocolitica subsp. enterocolitica 8081]AAK69217.1 YscY [Yersinia enterocolitica]AJJ21495.1 tetratricopeptide repeat family protein [Yersinia enterocolitica]CAL10043.1 conserved hypothetical protein [Yersinia enterocolitica subsp. enterocolitica 8081]CRY30910.1 required for Yop secretion [Yersinia enterocolitica]HDM8
MNITLTKRQQEFLLLNGWLQLQCGHAERACILLDALLMLNPEHLAGRRCRLVALLNNNQGERAEKEAQWLISHDPLQAGNWLCLSRAQQLNGDLDKARHAYQHYLELKDHNESL